MYPRWIRTRYTELIGDRSGNWTSANKNRNILRRLTSGLFRARFNLKSCTLKYLIIANRGVAREGANRIFANARKRAQYRHIVSIPPFAVSESIRAEGTGKQTLGRQGDSPRGKNRLSALSSNPEIESQPSRANISPGRTSRPAFLDSTPPRLSFEDCLDLGGAPESTGETGHCSRFDYGPAWKSPAIITRAPWRRWFRGNAITSPGTGEARRRDAGKKSGAALPLERKRERLLLFAELQRYK